MPQRASYQPTIRSAHSAVGPPLARHQQPFQRRVSRRRVGLQHPHRPRRHRTVAGPVLRGLQGQPRDAQLRHRRPPPPRPLPALRVDEHLPPRLHRLLEIQLRRQIPAHRRPRRRVPHLHLPLPARVRPHHQPRLGRVLRLPLQQAVDVASPGPRPPPPASPGTPAPTPGPDRTPGTTAGSPSPAPPPARPPAAPTSPARPPPSGRRPAVNATGRVHEQAPRAALAALKRTQALRAVLQPRVVQRRRVLHQQHRRLLPAALHQRLAVRLQDVLDAHLLIVQKRYAACCSAPPGEDRRQRLTRMPLPRRPQPLQTPPQPPVGHVRAPELAAATNPRRPPPPTPETNPATAPAHAAASPPSPRPGPAATRSSAPSRPPTRAGGPPSDPRISSPPPGSSSPDATPPRRSPTTPGRTPCRASQSVARRAAARPSTCDARCGTRTPANSRKRSFETTPRDVSPARAVVPAQMRVAGTQPQRRRHEAQHPHRTRRRLQQIRQPAARRPAPTARMGRLQQMPAQLPHRRRVRQHQPDPAQIRQTARKRRPRQLRHVAPTARNRAADPAAPAAAPDPIAPPAAATPSEPTPRTTPPARCANRPARTVRAPERPVTATLGAAPPATTRPTPAGECAVQSARTRSTRNPALCQL